MRVTGTVKNLSGCLQRNEAIAKDFARLCPDEVESLNRLWVETWRILIDGRCASENSTGGIDTDCRNILVNAMQTFSAALELTRRDYWLQPSVLFRCILEACCSVLQMGLEDGAHAKFTQGKPSSSKPVAFCKRLFGKAGRAYGFLSEEFVHVGRAHRGVYSRRGFRTGREGELRFNIQGLRESLLLIYIAAELVFPQQAEKQRFWTCSENKLWLKPTPEGRRWLQQYGGAADRSAGDDDSDH